MDEKLIEKVKGGLEEKGMEVLDTKKFRRSFLYEVSRFLRGSSNTLGTVFSTVKKGERKDLLAIQKESAKKESKGLESVNDLDCIEETMEVPKFYLLLEEEDVVVMDLMDGSALVEILVSNNLILLPRKKKIVEIVKNCGQALARLHSKTERGRFSPDMDKISFEAELIPKEIAKKSREMLSEDFRFRETFIHSHLAPGNVIHKNGKLKFIDWAGSGFSSPYFDLHRSREIFKKMDKHFFRLDLMNLWRNFFDEYKSEISFEFDEEEYHRSRIYLSLRKITNEDEKGKKEVYVNMLKSSLRWFAEKR